MPFAELKRIVEKCYGPALHLRGILPRDKRELIQSNLFFATVFLFVFTILTFALENNPISTAPGLSLLQTLAPRIYGLFLLVFSAAFIFSALEALHNSYYFKGLDTILKEIPGKSENQPSWEVATIVYNTQEDITRDFMESTFGQEILFRAGITEEIFLKFNNERTPTIFAQDFSIRKHEKGIVLASYVQSIFEQDEAFRHFLAENNINERQLIRAANWVTQIERFEQRSSRWWSRDNLGRIPGLGKTWAYGQTFYLEKYGHELTEDHIWSSALMSRREEDDEVEELEELLSRNRQANALLITNDVLTARRRVAQLYYKIREGKALPTLESRRIFMLDIETIVISTGEKTAFEALLRSTLEQAIGAGNIIVYTEHLESVIQSALTLGVDIVDVISPYLESDKLQIVVGELTNGYEKHLSHDNRIAQAFDVIQMKDVSNDGVFELLEQRAQKHEKTSGIVFTVPALEAIGTLADRYFPTGVMPDKAFDLLEELVPVAHSKQLEQIRDTDVTELVTRKAHVPVGEPDEEERDVLLHLEQVLHERVVAQENAITAISKALRRARSGVGNPKKPMGSFLFLGPTGVGKTETAKALAEVLFNNEEAMIRLDMSEFQTPNALEELIGSAESSAEGRLETLIRRQQYGVLLLDEFEKANHSIHHLFLQILDEGYFTTASGQSVNMRNLIIIATSNAGAELIWEWEQAGKDVMGAKKELIDYAIQNKLYRPELLNRFDDIIVFHALKPEHVRTIARLHLESLAKRVLNERNITMHITDELIDFVSKKGYDPQFGGRPLNRAIQEEIEQRIADEILAGKLHPGETYTFKNSA